jgi:hypothetical protein
MRTEDDEDVVSVLDAKDRARARAAVDAIARDLAAAEPAGDAFGHTTCDRAIFFAWHASAFGDASSEDHAKALTERIVELGLQTLGDSRRFGGFPGVAWTLAHVLDAEFGEPLLDLVDEWLLQALDPAAWNGGYDLVSGLVSHGAYALARAGGGRAHAILDRVLIHLKASVSPRSVGHTWHTPPERLPRWQREIAPAGYENFGLAHGVPGIIALLAAMVQTDAHAERARGLLVPAVDWLLSHERLDDGTGLFPTWNLTHFPASPAMSRGSRAGWCYGDPGIAVALEAASRVTGSSEHAAAAQRVARAAAARDSSNGQVFDAGLCHGAFGCAHIFLRLHERTSDRAMLEATRRWAAHGLDLRREGAGIGGYRRFATPLEGAAADHEPWVTDASYLSGSAGIGLALLTLLDPDCGDWDAPLMTARP